MDEDSPVNKKIPNEGILFPVKEDDCRWYLTFFMYLFEASNGEGARVGPVPESKIGPQYLIFTKLRFECSNKMFNYETCILRLRPTLGIKSEDHLVSGDSNFIIH